jgi:hypothetical protein
MSIQQAAAAGTVPVSLDPQDEILEKLNLYTGG